MKYIIELDSSERDLSTYPLPNDYTVTFDRPIYNVENMDIISGVIPQSQSLINVGNKQFQIDSTNIILTEQNYSDGYLLASNLETSLSGTSVNSVTFQPATNNLLFTGVTDFALNFNTGSNGYSTTSTVGPPAYVLGFTGEDTTSVGSSLTSGVINLTGPESIIVKITSGEDDIDRGLYTGKHVYFGRILSTGSDVIYHDGTHDPIRQSFVKGNKRDMTSLRIRFYWNNGDKLIPYDFNNRNHILKLELECNTDKFNSIADGNLNIKKDLPPAVELPSLARKIRDISPDKLIPAIIGVVLLIGLIALANRTVKENSTG
jgi:hypothetical protein